MHEVGAAQLVGARADAGVRAHPGWLRPGRAAGASERGSGDEQRHDENGASHRGSCSDYRAQGPVSTARCSLQRVAHDRVGDAVARSCRRPIAVERRSCHHAAVRVDRRPAGVARPHPARARDDRAPHRAAPVRVLRDRNRGLPPSRPAPRRTGRSEGSRGPRPPCPARRRRSCAAPGTPASAGHAQDRKVVVRVEPDQPPHRAAAPSPRTCTVVSSCPATTCAFVTTIPVPATQPDSLHAQAAGRAEHANDAAARPPPPGGRARSSDVGRRHIRARAR